MQRRDFIMLFGGAAAAWPVAARAQQPAMLRVGALSPLPRARAFIQGFEARMRELGYVEGQNYTLDWTDLQGQSERYPAAMQGLVDRKVDVIIASGPEDALKAATAATKTIPIVMAAIDYDPFALGYVTSLAQPTGNITTRVSCSSRSSLRRSAYNW